MSNASDGARIKVWPGVSSALSEDLQGGGGLGAVSNVTYDGMVLSNVDYAVEITQCYGQSNLTLCNEVCPHNAYLLMRVLTERSSLVTLPFRTSLSRIS